MKIIRAYPPNFADIARVFPVRGKPNVYFCYGDTIYNPSGHAIESAIVAHEEVHSRQQGSDPATWWRRYMIDSNFRLGQEVEAHRVELRARLAGDTPMRRRARVHEMMIARLRSQVYAFNPPLSRERAEELLS